MPQYESIFLEIGYDDVEDLPNFSERSLEMMQAALEKEAIPAGHVEKILRLVRGAARDLLPRFRTGARTTELPARLAQAALR